MISHEKEDRSTDVGKYAVYLQEHGVCGNNLKLTETRESQEKGERPEEP